MFIYARKLKLKRTKRKNDGRKLKLSLAMKYVVGEHDRILTLFFIIVDLVSGWLGELKRLQAVGGRSCLRGNIEIGGEARADIHIHAQIII